MTKTNNFPEFTGRVCPAPCEGACVLGITEPAVTIRSIEEKIAEECFTRGLIKPNPPLKRTGKKIAIVGSGPAGLAAADQLNKVGHNIVVFEKEDRIGGLLMYGIPNFKLEKEIVLRRIEIMKKEGIEFRPNSHVGGNIKVEGLKKEYDALVLCGGAQQPRDLPVEGRDLNGIHFAMEFLPQQTKRLQGDLIPEVETISAKDKNVLIIGGGDTGSDCLGTSLRQGAKRVDQFELLPTPPESRAEDNPWPNWPQIYRISSSHEEAIDEVRDFCVMTKKFSGKEGNVHKVHAVKIEFGDLNPNTGKPKINEIPGSEFELQVDLVLLAMGFLGPAHTVSDALGLDYDQRSNYKADYGSYNTNVKGVFAAGDCRRGQSLVVWAINEGRGAAREIDRYLMGSTFLP